MLNKVREAKKLTDLPQKYQNLFNFIHKNFAPKLQEELSQSSGKVSKYKTLYKLAPKA